jgi:hypothetical protein
VPPQTPAQVQVQGPVPATAEAVPLLHKVPVGSDVSAAPLGGVSQTPLTGSPGGVLQVPAL